jgi:ADP-ribosylglycohydrolase
MNERILSGIIGLAVGDALGVPVEFQSRAELQLNPVTDMRGFGTYSQPAGTWSDDSSMTLCLLDSLANGLDYTDIMQKFASWLNNAEYTPHGEVFDVGITTSQAVRRYSQGVPPLLCGGADVRDNGNGSLMRILPLAFYLTSQYGENFTDTAETFEIIHNVSALTHAHPRAKIGCGIYMAIVENSKFQRVDREYEILRSIRKARDFYENQAEFAEELKHYSRLFQDDFADLPEDEIKSSGYVVDTLEAAVWCFLNTDNYADCVLKAVNLGADTDTVAAVVGGIAGMYYGYESIPAEWVEQLARLDYIKELCGKLSVKES